LSAELSNAFTHPTDADSQGGERVGVQLQQVRRYSLAQVFDLKQRLVMFDDKPNMGRFTCRVAMNVRQAFLEYAKQRELYVLRQAPDIIRHFVCCLNSAPLGYRLLLQILSSAFVRFSAFRRSSRGAA